MRHVLNRQRQQRGPKCLVVGESVASDVRHSTPRPSKPKKCDLFAREDTTMDLKDFNFKHWWTLMSAAGALITAASVVPKSTLGVFAGLSLLFFGVGEWRNRPRTTVKRRCKAWQDLKRLRPIRGNRMPWA
jgi:hypothetical protein